MSETAIANEYVLGANDEEIARLGLQHMAWRVHALAAWHSAKIRPGQTWLDVGCGPGYASLDLAELLGSHGRVIALDKSDLFLGTAESQARQRGLANVTFQRVDLEAGEFPDVRVNGAWCRWVLCFVANPRGVLAKIAAALQPGGRVVLHEYFDYRAWRASPPLPELEEFVAAVMTSWRRRGGEPDIALQIPAWLEELGLEVKRTRTIVDAAQPDSMTWAWLRAFLDVNRRRLADLGILTSDRAAEIWRAFELFESSPACRMLTPGVLEIVAERGSSHAAAASGAIPDSVDKKT
jgi:ubiquinone/menaquinone biosynthesis C-methylase UbiE